MLCAAPTVLIGIAHGPGKLRREARRGVRVLTAGAPPAATTIERIEGELGWVITQAYGLTETSPFITICESRPEHEKLLCAERSVIKACQGVELLTSGELRVVDEEGHDIPHDGEAIGEIIVRGNAVMKGYYKDAEATGEAMRGGWFHTGDAAAVHPDGYVEIRDRLKDVIISGGENISSVEVEGALLRHPASCRKQPPARSRSMSFEESPRFRSSDRVSRWPRSATEATLHEFADQMLNSLLSLPAVVGEVFRSLDATPFLHRDRREIGHRPRIRLMR